MSKYLLIESRDPFKFNDVRQFYHLGHQLAQSGHQVIFFLVQDAVFAVRKAAKTGNFNEIATTEKVQVLADDFSLEERGILKDSILPAIQTSNMDKLVDLLMEGSYKTIWH